MEIELDILKEESVLQFSQKCILFLNADTHHDCQES